MRGQMTEGICEAGEIFFVPSGYWHSRSPVPFSLHCSRIVDSLLISRSESRTVNRRNAEFRLAKRITKSPQLYEISSGASIRIQITSTCHRWIDRRSDGGRGWIGRVR